MCDDLAGIISVSLLKKITRWKQIGASDDLINIALRKAEWPYPIEEIRRRLGVAEFRPVYLSLPLDVQDLVDAFLDCSEG